MGISRDIIVGGAGASGGVSDNNLKAGLRIAGKDTELTIQAIQNYCVSKNVYRNSADLYNAKMISGTIGYNYIQTEKTAFVKPHSFTSNDIIIGGAGASGGVGEGPLNGAVRLWGANSSLTIKAIKDYAGIKEPVINNTNYTPNNTIDKLAWGSIGNKVRQLQSDLTYLAQNNERYAECDPIWIDGKYEDATYNAVLKFQQIYGFIGDGVDGEVGSLTREAIKSTLGEVKQPKGDNGKFPDTKDIIKIGELKVGDNGEVVKTLQRNLQELCIFKEVISGNYDSLTSIAVQEFQLKYNVVGDEGGVAGCNTIYKLNSIFTPIEITSKLNALMKEAENKHSPSAVDQLLCPTAIKIKQFYDLVRNKGTYDLNKSRVEC